MSQHYQAAISAYQSGQFDLAATHMEKHLTQDAENADAWHLLGIMFFQSDNALKAIKAIEKALSIAPDNSDFLSNFGLVLKASGQLELAIQAYQKALQLNSNDLDIQLNLANSFMACDRYEEAAGLYRRLLHQGRIQLENRHDIIEALVHALTKMGNQAHQIGKFTFAEACFAEAVELKPNASYLLYNLGNAERELGQTDKAAQHYAKAVMLDPDNADAHNNLGNVQRELGQLEAAIKSYQKALSLNPKLHHAKMHLVHQKQHACEWDGLSEDIQAVRTLIKNEPEAKISPFAFLAMPDTTAQEQLQCANQWASIKYQPLIQQQTQPFTQDKIINKKLKIGYLSADFRLHPLAFLITDLIECHDREQFEVSAYAFGITDQTNTRKRLVKAFDHFHEIQTLSEQEAAQKIHDDGIDILVDLTGFTQTSRSGITALRPAKIHVSWLGFPGTMGYLDANNKVPLFDYLLTDTIITPPSSAQYYAEKLAYLPCYQPNDRNRPIGETPSRNDCELPENAFVFCSFNQSFKITPDIFASWVTILKATENSVLWLLSCHPLAEQNLINAAKRAGLSTNRIIFAPRTSIESHLARHAHADLFLDTPTYNAHTTCSDALWMNVPVLTKVGETFSSRVAASLLTAVGLPELIVDSNEAYEDQAIYYATQPDALAALKDKLAANKAQSILFDTPRFTQALETCYQTMLTESA